jgi:AraC-like DNA-binding protein
MGTGNTLSLFAGPTVYRTGTEAVALRPGLTLQLARIAPGVPVFTEFTIQDSPIIFGFMLAGLNRCRYVDGPLRRTTRIHGSGSNRITYLPDTAGSLECRAGMHRLSIIVSQEFLEPYLALERARTPGPLAAALSGRRETFQWAGRRSVHKMRLVADILGGPYGGALRRLHLEARALELIGAQLDEFLAPDTTRAGGRGAGAAPGPLRGAADVARIRDAREILVQDMENPPSLAELARMAGINEKKLKAGFKQVFGVPVFEYFRAYRLDMAREMLASGAMTVTEVAMHVGYQSLGHFSAEFRKKYGLPPKKFQTRQG